MKDAGQERSSSLVPDDSRSVQALKREATERKILLTNNEGEVIGAESSSRKRRRSKSVDGKYQACSNAI